RAPVAPWLAGWPVSRDDPELVDLIAELVADGEMTGAALRQLLDQLEAAAGLVKAMLVRVERDGARLREIDLTLPRRRGRPRAENPPSFRQDVLRMHRESGLGRRAIAARLQVSEHQVRQVLEEDAGEKYSARWGG